jgi:hypothetical protein
MLPSTIKLSESNVLDVILKSKRIIVVCGNLILYSYTGILHYSLTSQEQEYLQLQAFQLSEDVGVYTQTNPFLDFLDLLE